MVCFVVGACVILDAESHVTYDQAEVILVLFSLP
jgi:hypothetical protein